MGLDQDKLGAVFGQIGMGREHSGYRLADITQLLAREKRLAIGTQRLRGRIAKIDRRQVVDVRRGPHRDDSRHGQCSDHVDGPQHGIRISRAHDAHMQLMREADIADEGPLPGSSTAHPPAEPPTVRECGALSERRREWASPAYYSKRDVPSSVMMPARLGEGVIAMLPRSPWPTITPAPGRSCARPRGGGRG